MINYTLITKPGIIFGNLLTALGGFLLGSRGLFYPHLFFLTLIGLGMIIAAGCIFNNWIDRDLDKKMERTKKRPFASDEISHTLALLLASLLLISGTSILLYFTNALAATIAIVGFLIYVLPYSYLKKETVFATAIGSIAGATPPVIGYVAAYGTVDLGALLLFLLLIFWQMPHFYAIAFLHESDYRKAELPMLPFVKGAFRTKIHMALYIILFLVCLALLTFLGYTGTLFLLISGLLGLLWLVLSFQGFQAESNQKWGREMFQLSLITIGAVSLLMIV